MAFHPRSIFPHPQKEGGELLERLLELNKKKHSGKLAPWELDRVEREIAATDQEIENLVYQLCGITDEERRIIERSQ